MSLRGSRLRADPQFRITHKTHTHSLTNSRLHYRECQNLYLYQLICKIITSRVKQPTSKIFLLTSSVAQLASAFDCYISRNREVGSSSLPGGATFFAACLLRNQAWRFRDGLEFEY
jgi:hypothetical protein